MTEPLATRLCPRLLSMGVGDLIPWLVELRIHHSVRYTGSTKEASPFESMVYDNGSCPFHSVSRDRLFCVPRVLKGQ